MSRVWNTTGNWSETNGVITATGVGRAVLTGFNPIQGKFYPIEFTIAGTYDAGALLRAQLGSVVFAVTGVGDKSFIKQSDGIDQFSLESVLGGFTGTIGPVIKAGLASLLNPNPQTISDLILAATGGPTINGGLAGWYSQTASETLMGAENRWLSEQAGVTAVTNLDMWFQFLTLNGYGPGTVGDMKLKYWAAQ
jgi:hypothetical protein